MFENPLKLCFKTSNCKMRCVVQNFTKKVKFILKNSTMYRVHYDKQGTAL